MINKQNTTFINNINVVICLQRIKRGHELCTVILADAQFIDLFHRFHQDAR
jgi:hypothetical protein